MRLKWTERQFDFGFSIERAIEILDKLEHASARLEAQVRGYPSEILTQRLGEAWSIQEHIGHLVDLDELHTGRLEDYRNNLEVLRPADMSNRKTYDANHNDRPLAELLAEFRKERQHFVDELRTFEPEDWLKSALHERLGKQMRIADLAYFVNEHDDHHMMIMEETAKELMAASA